ncbi:MAG: hypothetical protein RLZZ526_61 [Actinomycetota bacterium]|jgi:hypothetical protein
MAFLRRKNQTPDPVLSAIDDLMAFSAQALEVNREEARVSAERLAMLEELVAKYGAALEAEKAANSATADRLNLIEQRLVSMGNELSHQLHEMGSEIEKLSQNAGDGAPSEILDALRTTQTKLAQEQARYEIAFRQDLAALADQLRRSR